VRPGSLLALANALGVTVDYLVGGEAVSAPKLLRHSALFYGADDEYLALAAPFLLEGLARLDCVLAVAASRQIDLLRDALGDTATGIEFQDSSQWYRSPGGTLNGYRTFVKERFEQGAHWIRVLGEPVWVGLTATEVTAWTRYESMINVALASLPVTIICPYDASTSPEGVLVAARCTHPNLTEAGGAIPSPAYREPEEFLLDPTTRMG
jgi:hypothetical protein